MKFAIFLQHKFGVSTRPNLIPVLLSLSIISIITTNKYQLTLLTLLSFHTDVKDLVSKCDIKKELLEHRHNTQILSDETAVSMKKNVYRNYKQFIDTSKEISCIYSLINMYFSLTGKYWMLCDMKWKSQVNLSEI